MIGVIRHSPCHGSTVRTDNLSSFAVTARGSTGVCSFGIPRSMPVSLHGVAERRCFGGRRKMWHWSPLGVQGGPVPKGGQLIRATIDLGRSAGTGGLSCRRVSDFLCDGGCRCGERSKGGIRFGGRRHLVVIIFFGSGRSGRKLSFQGCQALLPSRSIHRRSTVERP